MDCLFLSHVTRPASPRTGTDGEADGHRRPPRVGQAGRLDSTFKCHVHVHVHVLTSHGAHTPRPSALLRRKLDVASPRHAVLHGVTLAGDVIERLVHPILAVEHAHVEPAQRAATCRTGRAPRFNFQVPRGAFSLAGKGTILDSSATLRFSLAGKGIIGALPSPARRSTKGRTVSRTRKHHSLG